MKSMHLKALGAAMTLGVAGAAPADVLYYLMDEVGGEARGFVSAEGVTADPELVRDAIVLADAVRPAPTCLADLRDGWATWGTKLTREAAVKLNFFADVELTAEDQVYVYYLAYYRSDRDEDGREFRRWGAGVQLKVKVSGVDAKADLSLPFIAASTTLKTVRAEARMNTFGLSGPKIDEAIPNASDVAGFGIEGYVALLGAADKIRLAARDASTIVTPSPIFIDIPTTDEGALATALATSYALMAVRDGMTMEEARKAMPDLFIQRDAKTAFEDQFAGVTGNRSRTKRPDEIARTQAKAMLRRSGMENLSLK